MVIGKDALSVQRVIVMRVDPALGGKPADGVGTRLDASCTHRLFDGLIHADRGVDVPDQSWRRRRPGCSARTDSGHRGCAPRPHLGAVGTTSPGAAVCRSHSYQERTEGHLGAMRRLLTADVCASTREELGA